MAQVLLAVGVATLGAVGWAGLRGGLTAELLGLGALQGLMFVLFGVALLRRAAWSRWAYVAWGVAGAGFQLAFQATYGIVAWPVFWALELGFVVALVVVGASLWRDLRPEDDPG